MGPLEGIKVIEIAGIGPGPFCCMMLADMGAEVLRVDRNDKVELGIVMEPRFNVLNRGRRSVGVNLKTPQGVAIVKRLIADADALVEGFRPGVMERLGLGPGECLALNPRLVFGRMTGFGQEGPLARAAGHDINYIAMTGALHAIGRKESGPVPPLNLIGDFGGGAMYLAFGIVCALLESRKSGRGQVVDAAIVDGAASLLTFAYGLMRAGLWTDDRGENTLDSGAPWYDVYETRDGKYVSIGAIEERFYHELLKQIGLDKEALPSQLDRIGWPALREKLKVVFLTKTREEWSRLLEGTDTCFAPVLALDEAPEHPHALARGNYVTLAGIKQPGPAPRFSRTKPEVRSPPPESGEHTDAALLDWGFSSEEIAELHAAAAIA
jgi:alpha-methylacyl-CoA racemase